MAGTDNMERYFSGAALYGDDFSEAQIDEWVRDEENAYLSLTKSSNKYVYSYHALNLLHGFRHLADRTFRHALAFGCARGDDIEPVARNVLRFTAIEPAEAFWSHSIAETPARFLKPNPNGDIDCPNDEFDLISCLGVLHHIPNVSHVLSEFHRVLAPGGLLVLREPVSSMGDWRRQRPGLTKRERGLPIDYIDRILPSLGFSVVQRRFCVFPLTTRFAKVLGEPRPFNSKYMVLLDAILSWLFKFNLQYHRDRLWKKFAPGAVFIVAEKPAIPAREI